LLAEHDVVVFSKTTCPFCTRAKKVIGSTGQTFHVLELDELPEAETMMLQDTLRDMTGARTVPRVFVKGKSIGGCDDVVQLQMEGKLETVLPGARDFKLRKSDDEWRSQLDPNQYYVLRQKGTERPGSHPYDQFMPPAGHFACAACGFPLYSADSKFRSSCGWPVFDKCYFSEDAGGCHIGIKADFGSKEIICNRCDSHLGHVFYDAFSDRNPNGERH
jgi:peptide-methionine (R)-S-oxide reductase